MKKAVELGKDQCRADEAEEEERRNDEIAFPGVLHRSHPDGQMPDDVVHALGHPLGCGEDVLQQLLHDGQQVERVLVELIAMGEPLRINLSRAARASVIRIGRAQGLREVPPLGTPERPVPA